MAGYETREENQGENISDDKPESAGKSQSNEVAIPESWFTPESWNRHPCHPLKYCCEDCQNQIRELEIAAHVLGFQPIFTFFTEEQLFRMEDYMTGEERETMAKLPPSNVSPKEDNNQQRGSALKFLKVEHLDHNRDLEAKIEDTQINPKGKFGLEVRCKVAFTGGRKFIWALRPDNPNYDVLLKKFGDDTDTWTGNTILFGIDRDKFNEQEYIRVTVPATTSRKG